MAEQGGSAARISAIPGNRIAALWVRLTLPAGLDAVRIALDLRADAIVPGEKPWQTGRVQMVGYDRTGHRLWYWPHDVATLSGDSDWRPVRAIIPVVPELRYADLIVFNGARSGELGVRAARVTGLVERPGFGALRHGLLALWGMVGLWVAILLVRRSRRPGIAVALIACAGLALIGVLIPQPTFHQLTTPIKSSVLVMLAAIDEPSEPPVRIAPDKTNAPEVAGANGDADSAGRPHVAQPPRDYPFSLKQVGHFSAFLLLGLVAQFAFPAISSVRRLGSLMLFAVATETLQLFVITRSSSVGDLVIDAVGLVCAAGLLAVAPSATALARAWSRRRHRFAGRP